MQTGKMKHLIITTTKLTLKTIFMYFTGKKKESHHSP